MGTCGSENLDATARLQFEKKTRLQGFAESTSSQLISLVLPREKQVSGTHCSLIVKEEREDSSSQRVGNRKESEGRRGRAEKWQTWCCRDQLRACRLQRKKNIVGLPNRKGWSQCHKVISWQGRQTRLYKKEKEQTHQSRSPDREVGESHGDRKRGDRSGNTESKKWTPQ